MYRVLILERKVLLIRTAIMLSLQRLKTIEGGECQDLRYHNVSSPETERELLGYVTPVYKVLPTQKEESDKEDTIVKMSTLCSLRIE